MEIDLTKEEIEYLIRLTKRDIYDKCHPRDIQGLDIVFDVTNEHKEFIGSLYNKLKQRLPIDSKKQFE